MGFGKVQVSKRDQVFCRQVGRDSEDAEKLAEQIIRCLTVLKGAECIWRPFVSVGVSEEVQDTLTTLGHFAVLGIFNRHRAEAGVRLTSLSLALAVLGRTEGRGRYIAVLRRGCGGMRHGAGRSSSWCLRRRLLLLLRGWFDIGVSARKDRGQGLE